jgi:hypothetical protein
MKKVAALGAVAVLFLLSLGLTYAEVQVGVKAGDWIKYDAITSGNSSSDMPQWVKIEFLNVAGTTVTYRETQHMSNGTEQSMIRTLDVASATGNATFQLLVPANSKTGDIIQMIEGGNVQVAGEKTETYAGASRTVIYASLSREGTQVNYYWDKQVGILLEVALTQGSASLAYKATSTNIWQTFPSNPLMLPSLSVEIMSICISTVVAVVIVVTALIYTRRKRS